MRSRYSAHVKKNWGYLLKTLCAEERKNESVKTIDSGATWTGLQILSSSKGERDDQTGEVVFSATFTHEDGGEEEVHQERAGFIREGGRWVYTSEKSEVKLPQGQAPEPVKTFVREEPKVGRNDPCPCNSGKKYKKCCGK